MTDTLPIPGFNARLNHLPAKFHNLRDHQIRAVMDILDAFEDEDVVVLDAPTGSGKTVIAEVVRLMMGVRGVYVCHNKDLQTQFAGDFPYARVLWGRTNYRVGDMTCADCTYSKEEPTCLICVTREECPYVTARQAAIASPAAVLNSAYWINATLAPHNPWRRGLTVIDEADTLESVLMGQVSIDIPPRTAHRYGLQPPAQLTTDGACRDWAERTHQTLLSVVRRHHERPPASPGEIREHLAAAGLLSVVSGMSDDLRSGRCRWVYTGGAGSDRRAGHHIQFKPVSVATHGERLWQGKTLLMSGSVISSGMMLTELGYYGGHGSITLRSVFPARNRQVIVRPSVDMTKGAVNDRTDERLADAVRACLAEHPGANTLIHTVSYARAKALAGRVGGIVYETGAGRSRALRSFRQGGGVLVAPSMDRGIDLPDDLCRVQIITKVPYPNLGDRQISERMHADKVWYQVQVARTLVQMCGRAVRHEGDWAATYILDSAFCSWYRNWGHLLPEWFRRAIRFERGNNV